VRVSLKFTGNWNQEIGLQDYMAGTSEHPTQSVPPFFASKAMNLPPDSARLVLSCVLRQPGIAQPAIARETGLAQQSVSRIVKVLVQLGALIPVERSSHGRRGQPGMAVRIATKFAYTFGVSMMTDAISVALMDFSGEVLEQVYLEQPAMTRALVIDKLQSTFANLMANSGVKRKDVLGVGVGISGYCLDGKSRFNTPRQLDEWALVDIDSLLSEELDFPVWVENDGNAAAIGESLYGVGRVYSNFVYMYIAVGIGGGVVLNRELWRGANGNGGELGLILPSHVYPHPTIELLRQTIARAGVEVGSISKMLSDFDPSWPGIDEWIAKTSESFSIISSAIAALLDVQAIVLGGRMPESLAKKVIPHIEIFDDARRAEPRPTPRIFGSEVQGDASAIGAAALPFKKYFFSSQ